jgi:hypothetical protein
MREREREREREIFNFEMVKWKRFFKVATRVNSRVLLVAKFWRPKKGIGAEWKEPKQPIL